MAEGPGLENQCTHFGYRGFESLTLRWQFAIGYDLCETRPLLCSGAIGCELVAFFLSVNLFGVKMHLKYNCP